MPPRGGVPTMSYGASPNMGASGSQPAFRTTMNWSAGHSYPGGYKTYYEDNGVTFELTKSNYKEILTTAFQDQPEMKEQIDKSKFKHLDKLIAQYITFTKASD